MKKRLVVLFLIILTAFFALGIRLYLIQRDNGRSYTMQVLSQQAYNNKTLPCKRGKIMDSSGTVLADSQLVYNVIIDAKQMLEEDDYLEPSLDAAERLGIDREKLLAYITEHPDSQYYIARKNLPYQDKRDFDEEVEKGIEKEKKALEKAEEDNKDSRDGESGQAGQKTPKKTEVKLVYSNIKGIWFEESYIRTYPCKTLAADVIGFTVGDNTGAYGLEEYYEETLKGVPGRSYGYLDESLNMEQTTIQPKDGNNLVLTLDANIQSICEKYLNELNEEFRNRRHKGNGFNNGACIIMDVNTGGILAMASSPGFDLSDPYNISAVAGMPKLDENYNPISSYMSEADTQALSDADKSKYLSTLWSNYCISSHFEPGSTAKPFTTATGLETGKIKPTDKYECNGYLQVGDTYIRCVHVAGDGILDPGGAIERSCNVALMQEAEKIGADIFCKYQNVFNFGLKTNVDLAREARTNEFLYTSDQMSDVDLASNSFGQNFECTMIQMISGFCSLING
ncbi:MAG TPA: cell division protein FtsI, partial [Sarcina sp.]|nr:cell division protein FtsI [Sarcina sp.]